MSRTSAALKAGRVWDWETPTSVAAGRLLAAGCMLWALGCTSASTDKDGQAPFNDAQTTDGGTPDGRSAADATWDTTVGDARPVGVDSAASDVAGSDAANSDAASSEADAAADATHTTGQTAWGPITGACGSVGGQLTTADASFLTTTWTFKPSSSFDADPLSVGAKKRYEGENAGGSSICSEVMSMQLLHECEAAILHKTENEVGYTQTGAITDYITKIDGQLVGVSVTRAYLGPTVTTYTEDDAKKLLNKKLAGVLESTAHVKAEDKWIKQVLHIWTMQPDWVPILKKVWDGLDDAIKADTVVLVTIEKNSEYVTADTCDEEK